MSHGKGLRGDWQGTAMRVAAGLALMIAAASPAAAQQASRIIAPDKQLMAGEISRRTVPLSANFRVRVDTTSESVGPANAIRDRVRQRFSGSMVDFYPLDGKGFRLSAGAHLYTPKTQTVDSARTSREALYSAAAADRSTPRFGLRSTPAATVGYTGTIDHDTDVGFEMGALKGRSYAMERDLGQPGRGRDAAVNPMVNLVVGHRF